MSRIDQTSLRHDELCQREAESSGFAKTRKALTESDCHISDTDGHVDNLAAFIGPREFQLVLTMPTYESHPQYVKSMRAKEILEGSTDAAGDRLEVVCLPHPTGQRMVISEVGRYDDGG